MVRELNGVKRKLHKEFIDEVCDGDRKAGKERINRFADKKAKEENKDNIADDDSLDDMDLYGAPDSQESRLQEIYDIQKEIEEQVNIRDIAKASLKKRHHNCRYLFIYYIRLNNNY